MIHLVMSWWWEPSAEKTEPRYLKKKTLSRVVPSHCTFDLFTCAYFSFFNLVAVSTYLFVNICFFFVF